MNHLSHHLDSVPVDLYTGTIKFIDDVETAIDKKVVITTKYLSYLGIDGDECADKRFHGGPDRALHHYPEEHYAFWQTLYGVGKRPWKAPGMGENISSQGVTEDMVCIGDRYQLGEAVIEISQPRSPCFKLNRCWGEEGISMAMQQRSLCGWLYRVIQPGRVSCSSTLTLLERDSEALSVKEVNALFFYSPMHKEGLHRLMELKALSSSWTKKVQRRLATGEVEDWSRRLYG